MVSLQQLQKLEVMVTKLVKQFQEIRKQNNDLKLRVAELESINKESNSNSQQVEVGIQGVLDMISTVQEEEENYGEFASETVAANHNEEPSNEMQNSESQSDETNETFESAVQNSSEGNEKDAESAFSHPDDVPEEVNLDESDTDSNSQTEESRSEFDIF